MRSLFLLKQQKTNKPMRSDRIAFIHPSQVQLQTDCLPALLQKETIIQAQHVQCGAPRSRVSFLSSVHEVYEFIRKSNRMGGDDSEGFHSEEDTDIDYEDDPIGESGCVSQACANEKGQPSEKMQMWSCQDVDEELREAAESVLHFAGICTSGFHNNYCKDKIRSCGKEDKYL
ncbi:Forkhead box protein N2 [Galemys pyrenaicus]|uniref:Forkhead box protein N2 n=1 Tax=Galemys pyrenaicus TaxID=202257 RepID=A0A8J6DSG3_GALPY|nr:Forkhead box protein N2 [Galemys pyrenaicus]